MKTFFLDTCLFASDMEEEPHATTRMWVSCLTGISCLVKKKVDALGLAT